MGKETVTSFDVAQRAGVSQSAVSRVFSPGASASPKMAEKVRKAADELGYRPNVLARSLITGNSKIIGLVVAYFDNQFYPEAVEKLSKSLQVEGYHVLVFMASNGDDIDKLMQDLLDYQVEGIVLASVAVSSNLAEKCDAAGVPVVLFNRHQDDDRFSSVTSNNYDGGRKAAEFLIAGGHKRIAHIAGWEGASTQRDREAGFLSMLKEKGVELFARETGNFQFDETQEATRLMFNKDIVPDAVFVTNDHMAIAAMECLRYEFELNIPEDVSIIGYDDVEIASWPSYSLTTIRQPANRMVDETVKTLMKRIRGEDNTPHKIEIESPLMIRTSARIPQGWVNE
ncbi:MAG: LacI family DNA-binding transcriptional regulator [Lentilitoribacter sp.]